jgi:hypothetical protein
MVLGPTTAAALGVSTAPFKDVSTSNVFAGYIAYCSQKGIINGYADKTFRPSGTVTGYQFLKMLLGALGYDGKIEGFSGTNWEVNVAKLASSISLYDGNDSFVGTKAMTREEACLYAFNTLTSNMVKYTNKGTDITINGVTITQGASDATNVTNTVAEAAKTYNGTVDSITQFCEQYFSNLKLNSNNPDAFGRPAHTWTYGTTTVGTYKNTAVATFKGFTSASKVATALSGYYLKSNDVTPVNYKVNNIDSLTKTSAGILYSNTNTGANFNVTSQTIAKAISALTNTGKVVEIYADSSTKVITNIIDVTYTAAKVTSVTTTSSKTTYLMTNLTGAGTVTGIDYVDDSSSDDTISMAGTIAKDSYVTYVKPTGSSVVYVYPTTNVTGIQTAKNVSDETITVGSTTYSVATGVTTDGSAKISMDSFNNSAKSAVYYLDQFGNVIATTSTAASTDYAYIIGSYGTTTSSVDGTVPSAQLKVVLADGSVKTYALKLTKLTSSSTLVGTDKLVKYTAANTTEKMDGAAGDYVIAGTNVCVYGGSVVTKDQVNFFAQSNGIVGYTLSDSTISVETLTAADTNMTEGSAYYEATADNVAYGKTSVTANSVTTLFNSATKYVIYNSTTGTATVYTGTTGLPTTATDIDGCKVVMTGSSNAAIGTATIVYATVASGFTASTTSYAYIDKDACTESLSSGTTTYSYTGNLADGTTVTLTTTSKLTTNGLYEYASDKTIGTQVCADSNTSLNATYYVYDATLAVTGSLLGVTVGGTETYYNITSATKVVYIDSTKSAVNGNKGYVVLKATSTGAASTDVAAIYIVG